MKIKPLAAIKYILLFLVGVSIVYILFKDQHFPDILKDLETANWFWAILSAIAVIVANIFRALRWQLMIEPIAKEKPKFFHTFNALMIGYLTNLVLPRAGEITRCALLSKKENISITALIGTVITERIIDLVMLFGLILVALTLYSELVYSFLDRLNLNTQIFTDKLIWVAVLAIILAIIFLIFRYLKAKSTLFGRFSKLLIQLKDGLLSIKKIKEPFTFSLYTLLIWAFYILSSYLCFNVLQQTATLDYAAALLTVIAGSFGMIAPIQGGIGAFHFMVTETLALLNINKQVGLEFATIIHAAQTVAVIIFGLIALILEFSLKSVQHEPKQSETSS